MVIVIVTVCEWYYNSSKLITKYGSIQTLSVSSYYVQSQILNNKINELPNPKKKKKNNYKGMPMGLKMLQIRQAYLLCNQLTSCFSSILSSK